MIAPLFLIAGGNDEPVVTGVVIDENTGEPVPGVSIEIEGSDEEVYTDFDGRFEIKMSRSTRHPKLHFSAVSYVDTEITVSDEAFQRVRPLEVHLSSEF